MAVKAFPLYTAGHKDKLDTKINGLQALAYLSGRVRNLKFAIYLKFATCENTNTINELW